MGGGATRRPLTGGRAGFMATPNIRADVLAEMQARGYTIAELARLAGMTRANLSEWLAGKTDIRVSTAEQLMELLAIRVERTR